MARPRGVAFMMTGAVSFVSSTCTSSTIVSSTATGRKPCSDGGHGIAEPRFAETVAIIEQILLPPLGHDARVRDHLAVPARRRHIYAGRFILARPFNTIRRFG